MAFDGLNGYGETKNGSTEPVAIEAPVNPCQDISFNELLSEYRKDSSVISLGERLSKLKTLIEKYIELNESEQKKLLRFSPDKLIKAQRLKKLKETYNFFNRVIERPNEFTQKNFKKAGALKFKSRSEILIALMHGSLSFYFEDLLQKAKESKLTHILQLDDSQLVTLPDKVFVEAVLKSCISECKKLTGKFKARITNCLTKINPTIDAMYLERIITKILRDKKIELTPERFNCVKELLNVFKEENSLHLYRDGLINMYLDPYTQLSSVEDIEKLYFLWENIEDSKKKSDLIPGVLAKINRLVFNNFRDPYPYISIEKPQLLMTLIVYNQLSLKMGDTFYSPGSEAREEAMKLVLVRLCSGPEKPSSYFQIYDSLPDHKKLECKGGSLFSLIISWHLSKEQVDKIISKSITDKELRLNFKYMAKGSLALLSELGGGKALVDALIQSLIDLNESATVEEQQNYIIFIKSCVGEIDQNILNLADNRLLAQLAYILFKHDCPILFNKVLNAGASILGSLEEKSPGFHYWGRLPSLFDKVTSEQPYSTYNSTLIWNQRPLESVIYIKKCIKKLYKSGCSVPDLITTLLDKNTPKSIEYLFSLLNQAEKKSIFQDAVITSRLIKLRSPRISLDWFLSLTEENKLQLFQNGALENIALKSKSPEMLDYCLNKMNNDEVHAFVIKDETQAELRNIFTESGNFYMQMYCYCTGELMLGQELGHLPDEEMDCLLLAYDQLNGLSQLEKAQVLNFLLNPELKERRSSAKLLMGRCHLHDSQVIHDLAVQIAMFTPGLAYYQGHPLSQKALRTSLILLNQKLIMLETKVKGPLKDKHAAILTERTQPVSAAAFAAAHIEEGVSAGATAGSSSAQGL